jgi:hypothetical protein
MVLAAVDVLIADLRRVTTHAGYARYALKNFPG